MLKKLCERAFPKALWVFHCNTGACNGCDIEVINVLTPYYDAERFGIRLVGSPRHADVILVSGPVTRQVAPALRRLLDATPDPKLVFAVGSCACGGGAWFDTYSTLGGADRVIPVDYYIPGCPPRPEAILYGVALALGLVPKKVAGEQMRQETLAELAKGVSRATTGFADASAGVEKGGAS
jgi:Ni,Fe-hydrogenase III small subunit